MRLRNQLPNKLQRGQSSNNHTSDKNNESNIVQKYWPCFAIISCSILFTLVIYSTIHLTASSLYPICQLPETFLFPTNEQTFLTYIYPRDASDKIEKINNANYKEQKVMFLSTLKYLFNEQKSEISNDIIGSNDDNNNDDSKITKYRKVKKCFEVKDYSRYCLQFNVVYIPNRKHKEDSHKTETQKESIDLNNGIVEEFNQNSFNFHKVDPREFLMAISFKSHFYSFENDRKIMNEIRSFVGLSVSSHKDKDNNKIAYFDCVDWHKTQKSYGFHALFLNKYQIGDLSGVFVPAFWDDYGQYLNYRTLLISVQFLNLFPSSSTMRIGFNSIGAFASVNHLHFQFWDVSAVGGSLPLERVPYYLIATKGMNRIQVSDIDNTKYPIHGLLYELNDVVVNSEQDALYSDLEHLARTLFFCIEYLQTQNIAYNLVMIPGYPFKVFLIPRQTQSAFDGFDEFHITPGFPEVSGHVIMINEDEWENIEFEQIWNVWKERISVSDTLWTDIRNECLSMDT